MNKFTRIKNMLDEYINLRNVSEIYLSGDTFCPKVYNDLLEQSGAKYDQLLALIKYYTYD